jgi:methylisocitrate lyase
MKTASVLRQLLEQGTPIIAPSVPDPFSARIAERVGFKAIALGGYALGTHLVTSEPLLSLEEVAAATRRITRYATIPLIVDAGAGFGEPLHTMHTTRELERAGAAAMHIEDQHFPKRAHYHRGVEHVISIEEMVKKVRAAAQARQDKDFVIIARTDAMRTHGYEEGIKRAKALREAGADLIMIFPNTLDEAKRAPGEAGVPMVYTNSEGGRFGRPILTHQQLSEYGYSVALDAQTAILTTAKNLKQAFEKLHREGGNHFDQQEMIPLRDEIEGLIDLDEYYRIEEETVEGSS